MTSLHDVLTGLTRFWMDQGCLLVPTADLPLTSAVLHPEAFLRLLGPQPRRAMLVQPVRRPRDGRHGLHSYRLAKHLQFLVHLKPSPDDLLDLYRQSLEAIGFDLDHHDLRFGERRWRIPALSAHGLGWNVQLDGVTVTRVTYVQSAAGIELEPVSVNLSYGLERVVIARTGVPSAFDIEWGGDGFDYGRLRHREEEELSTHAFEVADVEFVRAQIAGHVDDAARSFDAGLLRIAYESAVRCLFLIDLLEARDGLAVGERAAWIASVQAVMHDVASSLSQAWAPETTGAATEATTGEQSTAAEDTAVESAAAEQAALEDAAADAPVGVVTDAPALEPAEGDATKPESESTKQRTGKTSPKTDEAKSKPPRRRRRRKPKPKDEAADG